MEEEIYKILQKFKGYGNYYYFNSEEEVHEIIKEIFDYLKQFTEYFSSCTQQVEENCIMAEYCLSIAYLDNQEDEIKIIIVPLIIRYVDDERYTCYYD